MLLVLDLATDDEVGFAEDSVDFAVDDEDFAVEEESFTDEDFTDDDAADVDLAEAAAEVVILATAVEAIGEPVIEVVV